MKIVHILPSLTKGGGERVAVDLANHAAAAGNEVTVVAGWPVDPALLADRLRPGIDVRYISCAGLPRIRQYAQSMAWLQREWRWLSQQDIVHCHMTLASVIGTVIYRRRKFSRAPKPAVVETYHGVGMPITKFERRVAAALAVHRDALALMAEDAYWSSFRKRHPRMSSRLILNGVSFARTVSPDERAAYRQAIGIPDTSTHVVGTIGALRPERRAEQFVPIFEEIARHLGPGAHFVIGGDGPMMPQLRNAVAASSIADRMHLPGLVPEPAVPLSIMDLYVTLNVGSVTGVAALEAAGAGVPVVAVQLLDDYRSNENDWIWSSRNPEALGAHSAALLSDPAALAELRERQLKYAHENHSVEAMAKAYESLYEAAIQKAAGASRAAVES